MDTDMETSLRYVEKADYKFMCVFGYFVKDLEKI